MKFGICTAECSITGVCVKVFGEQAHTILLIIKTNVDDLWILRKRQKVFFVKSVVGPSKDQLYIKSDAYSDSPDIPHEAEAT